jgi:hypothetical protein
MLKGFFFIILVFSLTTLNAQYSVNMGVNALSPFGTSQKYMGFHLGGEFPRDNDVSMYLRASFYGKKKLDPLLFQENTIQLETIDPNDFNVAFVSGVTTFNYTTIDGGLRYYLLDGYDNGFALYGGSNLMGVFNKAKFTVDEYDKTKYRLPTGTALSGTILNVGIGLSGGAKYTIPGVGSIYLDATFDYLLISLPSNTQASSIASNFYSPILFSLNAGFRKDFY